ncbi:MAG: putative porin, partial [bacterium]
MTLKRAGNLNFISLLFWLCVLFLWLGIGTASAQELVKTSATNVRESESTVADRVRLLEEELAKQSSKLDQMQKTISDQQQAIHALLEKLGAAETRPPAPAISGVPSGATATSSTAKPASTDEPPPSLEQRLGKVEGQVLKLGPFRFSGDFRLRADAIFRSAGEPPDPPLQHVQNVRARYRLRFNLDTDLYKTLSFHGQLATGPINNPLTLDQDFTASTTRAPFFLNEAWIDYHPNKSIQLQGGRVQEIFADNSRFLFDDDVRFNGFNEKYVASFKPNSGYISSVELRAGQYILTNPNVAVIAANSPLAHAGDIVGTAGRSANLFHQGLLINQQFNKKWSDQIGADIQLYRHPNQIQLASTTEGLVLLIQPGIGIALSGPLAGTGNATTTSGGAIYTAAGFHIARLAYRLNYAGFKSGDHLYPLMFNVQVARNMGTGLDERDAMLAAAQVGKITKRGDMSLLYVFSIKGANSLISQVTDDDLGTGT